MYPVCTKTWEGVEAALATLDDGGGYRVLADLKSAGEIRAIGVGVNHLGMIPRFLERFAIDYFLVAMPYTLLDQSALDGEFDLCARHGAGVVIGAPFASGILAAPDAATPLYAYQPAPDTVIDKVRRIAAVCAGHGVSLTAAALQFPLAHPVVTTVIPGANAPAQVEQNPAALAAPIPAELWAELKAEGLIRDDAPVPGPG